MRRATRSTNTGTRRRNTETRRYGHRSRSAFEEQLEEIKYYRNLYLKWFDFDILDLPYFSKWRKYIVDDVHEEENTDEEENATEEEVNNEIHVEKIDLKFEANAEKHHTDDYKCIRKQPNEDKDKNLTLVVRRGQVFRFDIIFNDQYDPKKHHLKLEFETGPSPSQKKDTKIIVDMDKEKNDTDWQVKVVNRTPNKTVEIEALTPPTCIIGNWTLNVYTKSKDKSGASELHLKHDEQIIILFNPWCKEDEVYFPFDPDNKSDVDVRDEYVLNPVGAVYRTGQKPKIWRYGQFETDIVQTCLKLVRRYFDGIPDQRMGAAHYVTRAISSVVNAANNGGILVGRWQKPYSDGALPTSWNGSVAILKQYKKTGEPVKYGQCWVFSGLSVTVARALGIPCRSITNYNSAHDKDATNAMEYMIDDDGETYPLNGDSIWNFHVWNEAWFARRDIHDDKYNGWQVFDATPQEESGGYYQCGPCPLYAVRNGSTHLPVDTGFVFAEVNSDINYYKSIGNNKLRRMKSTKNHVGKTITTKKPDGQPTPKNTYYKWTLLDVTNLYKYPEGSQEERMAVARATHGKIDPDVVLEEVRITLRAEKEEYGVGDDIRMFATVKNTSDDKKSKLEIASMRFQMSFVEYTENARARIPVHKIDHGSFFLNPDEEKEFDVTLTWEQYRDKRQDLSSIRFTALVNVAKSGSSIPETVTCNLKNPAIMEIEFSKEKIKVGETVNVTVTVNNPLPINLTNGRLTIEDEKFEDIEEDNEFSNIVIGAKSTWKKTFKVESLRHGMGQIMATLDTDELPDIEGSGTCVIIR